jgi:hypothetical protein
VNDLFQEATMPIEEVIAKYGAEQVEMYNIHMAFTFIIGCHRKLY